jgi:hypothetical protein
MRFLAILEVPAVWDSEIQPALLQAAYRASRRGPVALLMPDSVKRFVDRELNALVAADRSVHGVRYGRDTDQSIWASVSPDTLVIATSSSVQGRARSLGSDCLDATSGLAALSRLTAAG